MATTGFNTIDEYHATFPTTLQERMQRIRKLVNDAVPGVEETIHYQIPAFKLGNYFLIYYSAYTNHISISSPWSEAFLEEFADDLKGLKVTKSAIHFLNDKPLPLDLIKQILLFRKH